MHNMYKGIENINILFIAFYISIHVIRALKLLIV